MTEQKNNELNPQAQACLQGLMMQWFEFERQLGRVNIIKRLANGQFKNDDYLMLLANLRQQVIEGSRWISRCASSFDRNFSDVRSIIIGHATEEHKDYNLLEADYVNSGGELDVIQNQPKNVGSEALHGYLMYQASKPNPIHLIGAMWIIEGLGQKMASDWAGQIKSLLPNAQVNFMEYHGENDDAHLEKLYQLLDDVCVTKSDSEQIIKTAKVVARLYALQLEELSA